MLKTWTWATELILLQLITRVLQSDWYGYMRFNFDLNELFQGKSSLMGCTFATPRDK